MCCKRWRRLLTDRLKNRLHATQTTLRGPGTFNHKPLVLVAEADLWSGIPLTALGIDGRVGAGVAIAAAFETY